MNTFTNELVKYVYQFINQEMTILANLDILQQISHFVMHCGHARQCFQTGTFNNIQLSLLSSFLILSFIISSSVKVGHKRIFLFTNEDNPNANAKHLREQSFQRAKVRIFPLVVYVLSK